MDICQFSSKTELLLAIKKLPSSLAALLLFCRTASGRLQVGNKDYSRLNNSAFTLKGLRKEMLTEMSEVCFGTLLSFTPQDRDAILIDSLSLFSPVKGEQHLLLQEVQAIRIEFLLSGLQWLSCHDNTYLEYERRWLIQLVGVAIF